MARQVSTFLLLLAVAVAANAQNKTAKHSVIPETSHLTFVKEYIRELIADEDLKTSAEKELNQAKPGDEQFSTGIYLSRSIQLELRSQIGMLKGMHLNGDFADLIPTLTAFYQHEIDLHQKLIGISSKMLAGPKPGVDYGALAAEVPQIRADLDATQKALFEASTLVFMTLIDPKPDSHDHVSHLLITRDEKADLQKELETMLKGEPDKGDHDYYISAAMVLRAGLDKGHKCADEPWE